MNDKLKLWDQQPSWEAAETVWEEGAQKAQASHPLKGLTNLPDIPGITKETRRFLKWKSLKYIFQHDTEKVIPRHVLKHPIRYSLKFLKSLFKKSSYTRFDDFFLYGIKNLDAFKTLLKEENTLLVVGFSYCHKPFECPKGRFTDACVHDPDNATCRQCFIGKVVNAMPSEGTIPLFIPTIHYIGQKIFEIVEQNPDKKIIFIITACEMTLEMFGDLGNMVGIQGIGVRLDGRICNTMKAFELSEKGIKPGLTVVLEPAKEKILELIRIRREATEEAAASHHS
jgi:hypothetical protein